MTKYIHVKGLSIQIRYESCKIVNRYNETGACQQPLGANTQRRKLVFDIHDNRASKYDVLRVESITKQEVVIVEKKIITKELNIMNL